MAGVRVTSRQCKFGIILAVNMWSRQQLRILWDNRLLFKTEAAPNCGGIGKQPCFDTRMGHTDGHGIIGRFRIATCLQFGTDTRLITFTVEYEYASGRTVDPRVSLGPTYFLPAFLVLQKHVGLLSDSQLARVSAQSPRENCDNARIGYRWNLSSFANVGRSFAEDFDDDVGERIRIQLSSSSSSKLYHISPR